MEKKPEATELHESDEETEGGPVKTFLEHLEDLRWMLLKSLVAVILGMLFCFVAGNRLVSVLSWPLEHARKITPIRAELPVLIGTNIIGRLPHHLLTAIPGATNQITGATNHVSAATNHYGSLRLVPVLIGTNWLLAAQPEVAEVMETSRNVPILKNYTPLGGVMVALKLAIYGGIIISAPFVFFFVGSFVLPALKVKEKKVLYQAVTFGSVLFFMGVAFCYFVLAGLALTATVQFSQWLGFGADEWRAEEYITFMLRFMLGMGLGFELPVVVLTLVKIGLIEYQSLVSFRTYAIVGNLVIAAVATPSADPFTMFMMAIPLQILYEISVLIAWYWERRDRQREAAANALSANNQV
jgi:sec-independent protein translocase protein TatC